MPIQTNPKPEPTPLQRAREHRHRCREALRQTDREIALLKSKREQQAVAEYHAETAEAVAEQGARRAEHNALADVITAPERQRQELARQRLHQIWEA